MRSVFGIYDCFTKRFKCVAKRYSFKFKRHKRILFEVCRTRRQLQQHCDEQSEINIFSHFIFICIKLLLIYFEGIRDFRTTFDGGNHSSSSVADLEIDS